MISLAPKYYSLSEVADILSLSKSVLDKWVKSGKVEPSFDLNNQRLGFEETQLLKFPQFQAMKESKWHEEQVVKPKRSYKSVELFAGAGGLALGLEKAGLDAILLNEIDKDACATLRTNRPSWNVICNDISKIDFSFLKNKVDFLSGGFPCQAFSYAGKKLGFEDTRGTLFFEFARAIKEIQPRVFLGENVKGLLKHNQGNTLKTIKSVLNDLGYVVIEPKVLKAIFYRVPQKRERLLIVGIRKDLAEGVNFSWPSPYSRIMNLRDALYSGELFNTDVPESIGQKYPTRKKEILSHVPQGGYWRNLPIDLQKEFMKKSFYLGGGKTGMARRLSLDEPSLTLTCSPSQKQTERCHPLETRPLTVREYARIQTFPDEWNFSGSMSSRYKQIGNAVPVNLASAVGKSLVALLNSIEEKHLVQVKYDESEVPSQPPQQLALELKEAVAQYSLT